MFVHPLGKIYLILFYILQGHAVQYIWSLYFAHEIILWSCSFPSSLTIVHSNRCPKPSISGQLQICKPSRCQTLFWAGHIFIHYHNSGDDGLMDCRGWWSWWQWGWWGWWWCRCWCWWHSTSWRPRASLLLFSRHSVAKRAKRWSLCWSSWSWSLWWSLWWSWP